MSLLGNYNLTNGTLNIDLSSLTNFAALILVAVRPWQVY